MIEPLYDRSARTTAHILNTLWGKDYEKHILFSHIVFIILAELAAAMEAQEGRLAPSDN